MTYHVSIVKSAEKEFDDLSSVLRSRFREKILSLESNPRPHGSQKLRDSSNYRIRVGDYRMIYSVDDAKKNVCILSIAHRRDIYR